MNPSPWDSISAVKVESVSSRDTPREIISKICFWPLRRLSARFRSRSLATSEVAYPHIKVAKTQMIAMATRASPNSVP